MAKTIYKKGKPYKYISDTGKVTTIKDGKDPIIKSSQKATTQTMTLTGAGGSQQKLVTTVNGKATNVKTITPVKKSSSKSSKSSGLQAKIVEVKTGKVVQQGNFEIKTNKQKSEIRNMQDLFTKGIQGRKDLNVFQKEQKLRALQGISTPEIKRIEKKNQFTLKPNEVKKTKWYNLYGKTKELNDYLETQRRKAIRGSNHGKAVLLGLSSLPTNFVESFGNILIDMAEMIKSPKDTFTALKNIKKSDIMNAGARLGRKIEVGDPSAVTDIATEIITQKYGLGIVKGSKKVKMLSPKYVKSSGEVFKIKKPFSSVRNFLDNKAPKVVKDLLSEYIKNPEIVLKKQTVKTGAKTLAEQTKIAGQRVTAVNAAADQLTSWIKKKKIIRKPIPGEAEFPAIIKKSLKNFDDGMKLSKKEFANTNKWLKKNVAPNITLLERSLYADPASGLRISRLGVKKVRKATLKDIVKGQFKLIQNRPQVLIFENAKVASFPKNLKNIEKKLKSSKKLTENETNKLIAWQVKTGSGKFKPIGSTIYKGGIELEVTLAPGEFIKRIKKVGFTYINGKKVDFVTAQVYKPAKALTEKVRKAKLGKLTDKQILALEKDLSKKLGRKIKVETPKSKRVVRTTKDLPVLRVEGKYFRVLKRIGKIRKKPKRTPTKRTPTKRVPTKRTPTKRTPTKRTPTKRTPTKRTPTKRTPTKRTPTKRTPTKRTPTKRVPTKRTPTKRTPTKRTPTKRTPKKKIKLPAGLPKSKIPRQGYIVKIKKGNRIIAQTEQVLPLNRAKSLARKTTDNTVGGSHTITKSKKTYIKDIKPVKKNKKFRPKKSRSKKVLREVEKKKYRIDTKGEKKGLTIAKKLKPKKRTKTNNKK
jgi:hypothetical protein